jgi:DNA-binding NarL/FixJ family response regulator
MIELKQAYPPITMAIVSTNQLVRLGLQAVIKSRAHIRLIGESMGVIGAEDVIAREKPDILLVEMAGKIDILEWIQKIKISIPSMKIILLSGVEETHSTWQALSSGIDGIVLSIQPTAALLATIDYVCGKPAKAVLDEGKGTNPLDGTACALATACPSSPKGPDALTKREHEIIDLIGQGLSNKDIAGRLCICSTTVRHHLTSIFDKLGVTSRQKLLIRAHQQGLVELKTKA